MVCLNEISGFAEHGDNAALVDESKVSDGAQEMCSGESQTLPILYKIEQLSSKVQVNSENLMLKHSCQ